MKLCVFQGTFNPIHNAHLRIANFVVENNIADKVLFIPAYIPPHKFVDNNLAKHRYKMVELAVEPYDSYEVSDIEYERQEKSYTFNTIKQLYELHDIDSRINFIIGTDAFDKIETWYHIDELKYLVHFIVFKRQNEIVGMRYNKLKYKNFDFEIQSLSFDDISSTTIREYIKNNKSITGLVPKDIERYILENELYK